MVKLRSTGKTILDSGTSIKNRLFTLRSVEKSSLFKACGFGGERFSIALPKSWEACKKHIQNRIVKIIAAQTEMSLLLVCFVDQAPVTLAPTFPEVHLNNSFS